MNRHLFKGIAFAACLAAMTACGGKDSGGNKANADYDRALSDSIEVIEQQIDSCNSQISVLRNQVNGWLRDFTTVSNSREAAPYMILTSFRNRYPLKNTGLVARINDSGQFELVAALAKRPFDCISVVSGSQTVNSAVVPNDQALNYRTDALTTVSFTGAEADSIGMLVSNNELNPITVTFINGKPVQTWKMSGSDSKMISYTYLFYKTNRELQRLERRVPMLHEKINLLRIHKDRTSADSSDSAR